MKSKCVWQGRSNGREGTTWTGSFRCLRKKIPNFSQIPFGIDKDSNKYMDIIVRQPISDVTVDLGYVEATTRERIPVAAVYNGYGADLYRGRPQGYKLVEHHTMLDDVLEAATLEPINIFSQPESSIKSEFESLEATLYLSIYGARMYIEFLLPYYREDYTLKVACRNSVDKKHALTISLSVVPRCGGPDIPFSGFYRLHTQELRDGDIRFFLHHDLRYFLHGKWTTVEADREDVMRIIRESLTPGQQEQVISKMGAETQDRVRLLRFRQILAELFNQGRDIFQSGEHAVRLADLTNALNQLANEADTQQLMMS